MKTEIKTSIKTLAERAKSAVPHEALHLSQAALNLAHVLSALKDAGQPAAPPPVGL